MKCETTTQTQRTIVSIDIYYIEYVVEKNIIIFIFKKNNITELDEWKKKIKTRILLYTTKLALRYFSHWHLDNLVCLLSMTLLLFQYNSFSSPYSVRNAANLIYIKCIPPPPSVFFYFWLSAQDQNNKQMITRTLNSIRIEVHALYLPTSTYLYLPIPTYNNSRGIIFHPRSRDTQCVVVVVDLY